MSKPEERWYVGEPQWTAALDRPLARLMHRTDDDALIVIITLGAWFILVLILAMLEAAAHNAIVNPIRWLFNPAVRTAGWTVKIDHRQPTDPDLLPDYKRESLHETSTESTIWIPSRALAKALRKDLREYLKSGGKLNDQHAASMLASAGAQIIKAERKLVT